jgi:error-prone DNA polymerase
MQKSMAPVYAELQVTSNFSFLRGASHPEELVAAAADLGLAAIAITDRNTLAGAVRAHIAAKKAGIRLLIGARLDLEDAPSLLCFPQDRAAYGRLCRLITLGRRRAPKGGCRLTRADVVAHGEGQILIVVPPENANDDLEQALSFFKHNFNDRLYLSVHQIYRGDDCRRVATLAKTAAAVGVPLVATNDVHAHAAHRRPLQDVLNCIREGCTLAEAGYRLFAHGERHLKSPAEMARLFLDWPEALARTVEIARRCSFSLDELRYEYPVDPVPCGRTPQQELARLAWLGAGERYPEGIPAKVEAQIHHELALIEALAFAPYFLTVHDIVRFARERDILCQGRGSAANSAVCYCLGITSVDPARIDLLFERFVSAERNEPPDIDVDFEHERREEVIQYIYAKYGRERAGMTATVISYRTKSALREVGKVMALSEDAILALQTAFWRRRWEDVGDEDIRRVGLDPQDRTVRQVVALAGQLVGFPRHLSQHTGGMVITRSPLSEVVPIENAAMAERTVIEWDKDDLDALGILKIDILGLGMLTCVRKAFGLIGQHHHRPLSLASVPAEDPRVYDMLCQADSVGVFQVESRAQMSMLPRLKPRNFYDLVIEVAIVRPGPIQGDMVHPYLRRRHGTEPVSYPSRELEEVLGKTLGVPLFQEQAMRIAIVAAGFTPSEADALRRAMATFRRSGAIHDFKEKFIAGMVARDYPADFADRCFKQIEGFADYGFPESHAASFALIVYVSAWLKCHYPAAFACALLNSQPMGFYAPAQIVGDARRHGVEVRPVDVNFSHWDCTLESADPAGAVGGGPAAGQAIALRLGFRQVKGLAAADGEAIVAARGAGYGSIAQLARRAGIRRAALKILAAADAFSSLGIDRRQALWAVGELNEAPLPLFAVSGTETKTGEPKVRLPAITEGEQVAADYRTLQLSLKGHPLALLRHTLRHQGFMTSDAIAGLDHGRKVKVAGLVITRQRPGSANGVIFITLEDEVGQVNLIIWPGIFERFREIVLTSTLLAVDGPTQREGSVLHVLAERLWSLDGMLGSLTPTLSPNRAADEAKFDVPVRDFH